MGKFPEQKPESSTPLYKGAPNESYTVIVHFSVDASGTPGNFTPLTKCGYGMEEEVVRVISHGPRWIPAVNHGRKVKMYRTQPVTFVAAW